MKWLSFGVVGPIAILTVLALPIHLSITDTVVRIGHHASFRPETYLMKDVRSLTIVDAHTVQSGHSHIARDVTVGLADGRQFRGNQVGDGGTSVRNDVLQLLIDRTGLTPQYSSIVK
jgi:hypothetical protein